MVFLNQINEQIPVSLSSEKEKFLYGCYKRVSNWRYAKLPQGLPDTEDVEQCVSYTYYLSFFFD